jgi:hypothetical protein
MSNSNKYGNDNFWCFIESYSVKNKEIAIWHGYSTSSPPTSEIIARAIDEFEAKKIIDALIAFDSNKSVGELSKKELAFLEFIEAKCQEPYSTMAGNAIIWKDREAYFGLLSKFSSIYS